MAVIVAPEQADAIIEHLDDGTQRDVAFRIGEVAEGPRGCTVTGKGGSWDSDKDWSVTHNA